METVNLERSVTITLRKVWVHHLRLSEPKDIKTWKKSADMKMSLVRFLYNQNCDAVSLVMKVPFRCIVISENQSSSFQTFLVDVTCQVHVHMPLSFSRTDDLILPSITLLCHELSGIGDTKKSASGSLPHRLECVFQPNLSFESRYRQTLPGRQTIVAF